MKRHAAAFNLSATDEEYLGWCIYLAEEAGYYANTIGVKAK